ncbi:hypothetical protein AeNC1_018745, partial [Aphanomyces euteiches]
MTILSAPVAMVKAQKWVNKANVPTTGFTVGFTIPIRNRSTLLRSIEKRYGNQTWSVRDPQTGQYMDLDGPQLPT